MRILIIQTAFLGDVVLATALLESIHAAYPEAQLDMLVRAGNQGLLAGHPYLRNVLVWDKRRKWASWWALLRKVRASRYGMLVCVQRFASMGMFAALAGARHTAGFAKNPLSIFFDTRAPHLIAEGVHEVDRNHGLLTSLPLCFPARPRIYPDEAAQAQAAPWHQAGPYVCVAPASVWFTKQWPSWQWARLIAGLPPHLIVYLIGSPADEALARQIIALAGRQNVTSLCGQLSIMGSAALIARAQLTYCNDSGPLHLASATNAPVAAVFCSTVPAFGFGPLSDQRHIIQEATGLPCRPCGLHGHSVCPRGHFLCARTIDAALIPVSASG